MGYMRHHAIVVSSWDDGLLVKAHAEANRTFAGIAPVTAIVTSNTNSIGTFLVAPDGSKEDGWKESDDGDQARASFIAWLDQHRHEDGSTSLRWVEVQYGDDQLNTAVLAHSDEPSRRLTAKPE